MSVPKKVPVVYRDLTEDMKRDILDWLLEKVYNHRIVFPGEEERERIGRAWLAQMEKEQNPPVIAKVPVQHCPCHTCTVARAAERCKES